MNPDWDTLSELNRRRVMRKLDAAGREATINVPIRDSFHTAPGYRELAVEYSAIPDAVYPYDPAVLRAIQEFDPTACALWVRWAFLSPSDDGDEKVIVCGRHALGSTRPIASDTVALKVELPIHWRGPKPTKIVKLWADDNRESDLPGKYRPFDMGLYRWARMNFIENKSTKELVREVIDGEWDRQASIKKAHADEMEYRQRDISKFADKMLSRVSDAEAKDYMGSLLTRKPSRRLLLDLGSTPRR